MLALGVGVALWLLAGEVTRRYTKYVLGPLVYDGVFLFLAFICPVGAFVASAIHHCEFGARGAKDAARKHEEEAARLAAVRRDAPRLRRMLP